MTATSKLRDFFSPFNIISIELFYWIVNELFPETRHYVGCKMCWFAGCALTMFSSNITDIFICGTIDAVIGATTFQKLLVNSMTDYQGKYKEIYREGCVCKALLSMVDARNCALDYGNHAWWDVRSTSIMRRQVYVDYPPPEPLLSTNITYVISNFAWVRINLP